MITELTIKNVRCFNELSLTNITPVTLISGENNIGKTALLESIFLFLAYRLPDLFIQINNIRGIPSMVPALPQGYFIGMEPLMPWETLFPDMDMTLKLNISAKDDTGIANSVCFEKDTQLSVVQFAGQNNTNNMFQPVPGSYLLNVSYESNGEIKEKGHHAVTQNSLVLKLDKQSPRIFQPVAYIGPNDSFIQHPTAAWLGEVEKYNKL